MIILTDLSEVLIHGVEEVGWRITTKYGLAAGTSCYNRMAETYIEFYELLRGHITEDEYCEVIVSGIDCPFTTEDIKKAFTEEFKVRVPGTFDLYRSIAAYPETLAENAHMLDGVPSIIIVSDHIDERIDEIMNEHPDIFAITDDQIWSCDVGKIKRDPGFFTELLERLNLNTDEVVFIDDNNTNIEAAEAVGITSILFENAEQLETSLNKLGFEFYA